MTPTEQKAPPQGLVIDDLSKIRKAGTPLLSPDDRFLAYHVAVADYDADERYDLIMVTPADQTAPVTIARGIAHGWSPDGRELLYETANGELHIYTVSTAASRLLTRRSESAYFINHLALNNCIWSPDGQSIAFVGADVPEAPEPAVRVIDDLLYKSKGGRGRPIYADRAQTHIYRIPAAGGAPEPLTSGPFNEHSTTWSPDGRYIAFVSNRTDRPDDIQQSEIWKVDIHSKAITPLSDHRGLAYQPAWSPKGGHIAFLATPGQTGTNDSPAEDTHIALIPADGGQMRYLTKSLDRRIEHLRWHPSGKYIYFTAGDRGDTSVYRVSIENNHIETVQGGKGCISEFCLTAQGEDMVFIKSNTHFPPELFRTKNKGAVVEPVTQENAAWLSTKALQPADPFWFESFDGMQVQGWLMKPVAFDPSRKHPLILVIHGGPHNMFGHDFDERFHLLSQAGYAVVYINPRGSHGYGQAFSKGTLMNWGGGDYQDLMAGVDYILAQNPWLDADNLGVTGQSYGGYMTNWIVTQTTRFKAAVTDGGLSNLVSFSGTSLYHSLMESEFGGRAYDRFDLLWKWSPLRHVVRVTTPTLLLHGETDNEVPFTQAEEMYIALRKKGVDTMLVQYTGEGHGWRPELGPRNKADLNQRMIAWLNKYLTL
ncbi:S9 family peptidase [Dyadobacter fermentans]|uniref:Peptidase S9 prolyl oligopeptidase active site domain protein n=1 Tax=Dyadobacter fermentans (strain ATCC 700827 / DSM 18053 / CIP 107007 / KCTC 52180 / NS114) TaxID=471854 RepID=C6VTK6_DYAFD|nr:S9 family peptidase [Dyadobacter fermentans]ACT92949.1 peptidase S9 prolyl oligopeptidase active site domain protein [Dyadobacter fermentans DSM 18053]